MELLPIIEMKSLTGERAAGATLSSVQAVKDKLSRTSKPHCLVLAWVLIDVEGADLEVPTGSHLLPLVLYSHQVVSHSSGRLTQGDEVLTGFATHYDPRGIFETADTVYILLHEGFRKTAHLDTVRAGRKGC